MGGQSIERTSNVSVADLEVERGVSDLDGKGVSGNLETSLNPPLCVYR